MSVRSARILVSLATALAVALMPNVSVFGADTLYNCRFLAADGSSLSDGFQFEPHAPTFFVVHGFRDTGVSAASLRQANAIQRRFPQANVIVVDWYLTPPSQKQGKTEVKKEDCSYMEAIRKLYREYQASIRAAESVGRDIARCIKQNGISPHRTVISGHSLGAQIAAYASNECARPEMCCEPIHAIIAADPAGPCFELRSPELRLDPTDAQHVVVVHTTEVFGDEHAVGTSDVYLDWPEAERRNDVILHSLARELVTAAFQNASTATVDPAASNGQTFDLKLVPQLNPSSKGSGNVDSCLRDVVFEIDCALYELVSERPARNALVDSQ